MDSLSKRQQQIYNFIESYIEQKGFGPTVREICEAVNLSSPSTVHVHLKTLEDKGYIVRDSLKSRSIAKKRPKPTALPPTRIRSRFRW